jgi:hypothetical protein
VAREQFVRKQNDDFEAESPRLSRGSLSRRFLPRNQFQLVALV